MAKELPRETEGTVELAQQIARLSEGTMDAVAVLATVVYMNSNMRKSQLLEELSRAADFLSKDPSSLHSAGFLRAVINRINSLHD